MAMQTGAEEVAEAEAGATVVSLITSYFFVLHIQGEVVED